MPAMWAAGIAAVGQVAAASATQAPDYGTKINSSLTDLRARYDNSGWNVAMPGSTITSSRAQDESQRQAGPMTPDDGYMRWVVIAVIAVVALKALKRG